MKKFCMAALTLCLLAACGGAEKKEAAPQKTLSGLEQAKFVSEVDGKPTALYVLTNQQGAEACVTNWGGRLVSVMVPDKNGKLTDVVLGYDNIDQYVANPDNNYGGLIGRYGNRIANAKFTLDGAEYNLPQNNNGHCLHGGPKGYHAVVWDAKQLDNQTLELTYLSPDGEAGFPGNLKMKVTYTLREDNAIQISYEGVSDKKTIINMTNHSYFNLSGHNAGNIENTELKLNCSKFTPVVKGAIPTGELKDVEGTVFDFREFKTIGQDINAKEQQLKLVKGYDHNFVVDGYDGTEKLVAVAKAGGRTMEVYSDLPGIQFYAGNCIAKQKGKDGVKYTKRSGFCLETQYFPDNVNQDNFKKAIFDANELYKTTTVYKFVQ